MGKNLYNGGLMKKEFVFRLTLVGIIALLVYQFGVKPMFSPEYFIQKGRNIDWAKGRISAGDGQYDVIVVGEEPDGITAAVSASRLGAKTLLISGGKELGGTVFKSLYLDMEFQQGSRGERLERGMASELADRIGKDITVEKYKNALYELAKQEKNLEVIYNTELSAPILDKGAVTGVIVSSGGEKRNYTGKRLIDATRDGKLLEMSGVQYFTGSEDLNLEHKYQPVSLNFEVDGISPSRLKTFISKNKSGFTGIVSRYDTTYINSRIGDFRVIGEDNGRPVIQCLELVDLDVSDPKAVVAAYRIAVNEAKELTSYISKQFGELKGMTFSKAAESFYIKENRHFKGEYVLSVNDILDNRDFNTKIALASSPVEVGKFAEIGRKYILGKPAQYSIPLGCIVPLKVENLIMTGSKISYSSLAATSAAAVSTNMTVGESAGAFAVYSIVAGKTPREVLLNKSTGGLEEFTGLIKKQGVFLPEFKIPNKNASNWYYADVRKLNSLGLVAGGIMNDYRFSAEARQVDLATLLLNGVYRVAREKYTLEFDSRLRPFFINDKLTKEKLGEILIALYGVRADKGREYDKACGMGYVNSTLQLTLKDKKVLTLDDVYNASVSNIQLYTKKDIPD